MTSLKRVLVISNNCFSQSNSNGRTLGNLFHGWPKDKLAQFCVIAKDPNWDLCDNYYCLEDKTVLHAFLHLKKAAGRSLKFSNNHITKAQNTVDTQRANIGSKTLYKVMLRELVWSHKRWNSQSFQTWVNDFNPEVVVLQVGDTSFMIEIAMNIARLKKIPLLVYNTEGYYFFPRNWHAPSSVDFLLFPIYRNNYKKKFKKLMQLASHSVYLNDKLQEDYDKAFDKPSSVIYNSSDMVPFEGELFSEDVPIISYLGNLGLDRDSALIEVGEVLQQLNSNYHIDVYGSANETMKERFKQAKGVEYHGMVSYDKVKEIIGESDILFHVESEAGYKARQLQYAFSGKIADSISSGKCFVLYAPKALACSKYLIDTGAGWFAESKENLKNVLQGIISKSDERNFVLSKARAVAKRNHTYEGNASKFQNVINHM